MPVTEQRLQVAQVLFSTHKHLSVQELLELLRGRGVRAGKATVYRTLALLVESGLVGEHDFGEGFKRYEYLAGPPDHEHLVCEGCGKLIEFESAEVAELKRELARTHGFEPRHHRLEIYGLCEDCRARQAESRSRESGPKQRASS